MTSVLEQKPEQAGGAGLRYPRVLLKLSAVALAGERGFGFDFATIGRLDN